MCSKLWDLDWVLLRLLSSLGSSLFSRNSLALTLFAFLYLRDLPLHAVLHGILSLCSDDVLLN